MPEKKKIPGNPIVVVRLSPEMLAWIDACVSRSQTHSRDEPYDRSSFIRASLQERFDKYQRARAAHTKKKAARASSSTSSTSSAPTPVPDLMDGDQVEHMAADLATPHTE